MAIILNIETSGPICSVAISVDGVVEYQLEDENPMKHAERLAPFVEKCLGEVRRRELKLDAVAVSIGPGSYTGLRIGLSLAKGLCFGLGIPLLGIDTLQILAVKAMFLPGRFWEGDEILIPMIDARRMEVWTAAYDFTLNEVVPATAMILDENSFKDIIAGSRKVLLLGEAAAKASTVIKGENVEMFDKLSLHARDMIALSEKALRDGREISVAYSTPKYLKEYQTTVPKRKLF